MSTTAGERAGTPLAILQMQWLSSMDDESCCCVSDRLIGLLTGALPLGYLCAESAEVKLLAVLIDSKRCGSTSLGRTRVHDAEKLPAVNMNQRLHGSIDCRCLQARCWFCSRQTIGRCPDRNLLCSCLYIPHSRCSSMGDSEPIGTSCVAAPAQSLSPREKSARLSHLFCRLEIGGSIRPVEIQPFCPSKHTRF
jgi:hypothetical protein